MEVTLVQGASGAESGEAVKIAELRALYGELIERDVARAEAVALEAYELSERGADDLLRAECLLLLGGARLQQARYAEAESDLHRAAEIGQRLESPRTVLRSYRHLLRCAFLVRNLDDALLRGMQALQLAREIGDRNSEALSQNDLGLVYGFLGDHEAALEHLLAGLRILREEGKDRQANLFNNIGNVYLELGDHAQALGFFEAALEAFREAGQGQGQAIALGNIGRAHAGTGVHEQALTAFTTSLQLFEERRELAYCPPALARLASSLSALGRHEEADGAFRRAFTMLDSSASREFEEEILVAAAQHELSCGRADEAVTILLNAMRLQPAGGPLKGLYELHQLLASAYETRNDHVQALHHFREYHKLRMAASDTATSVRVRGLMLQFEVEQSRQQEEISRLKNIELTSANEELKLLQAQLEDQNSQLHRLSLEDPLTGVSNRRYLELQLPIEISRAHRHRRPLSAAMCDIDYFKSINDEFSHGIGDQVLRGVGEILRKLARITDMIVRYGGEEFLLILPDTDRAGAERLAFRIREALENHSWAALGEGLRVTLSIGIAELTPDGDEHSLLHAADSNLYVAKHRGRDQVVST